MTHLRAYDLGSLQQTCTAFASKELAHRVVRYVSAHVYPSSLTEGFTSPSVASTRAEDQELTYQNMRDMEMLVVARVLSRPDAKDGFYVSKSWCKVRSGRGAKRRAGNGVNERSDNTSLQQVLCDSLCSSLSLYGILTSVSASSVVTVAAAKSSAISNAINTARRSRPSSGLTLTVLRSALPAPTSQRRRVASAKGD